MESLALVSILVLVVVANAQGGRGEDEQQQQCYPSSCGNLNISHPFRLKGNPPSCGDTTYELACEGNRTVLYLYSGKYYVKSISYQNLTIQVVDSALQENNCSSLPSHSLTEFNFTSDSRFPVTPYKLRDEYFSFDPNVLIFTTCGIPVVNSSLYVDTTPYINGSDSSKSHSYVLLGKNAGDVKESCTVRLMIVSALFEKDMINYPSYSEVHRELVRGVELSWENQFCHCHGRRGRFCSVSKDPDGHYTGYCRCQSASDSFSYWVKRVLKTIACILLAGRFLCGIIGLSAYLIYKLRRRHLSMDENIEEFLQSQQNLMPIRYSYSEIRKITKGFKNKLGQGGYGSVFQGKLRSGRPVAVKILSKPKANGQEFINEVATIGRIHHVNVVRLTGFCVEGSKRALIYDFMPNGSLEKHIFPGGEGGISLCWEKMYEIALGVAHGIKYLHQGCDMQILHFDIKPHNILLDEKFTPKVSDFGLAKLYPVDDSIVSLTAARGTIGYIAPELFYKNIGGVSYKADVYSFGMLLMEMVGRRKNVNPFVENSSQIYFPGWIYDRFSQGEEMEIGDADEDEKKIVRKLILVGLWCIQMKPVDRPSMGKVIEMLEGPVELLQVPAKPLLFSPGNMSMNDNANSTYPSEPSIADESESIPLNISVD